jgi:hypothetical protein
VLAGSGALSVRRRPGREARDETWRDNDANASAAAPYASAGGASGRQQSAGTAAVRAHCDTQQPLRRNRWPRPRTLAIEQQLRRDSRKVREEARSGKRHKLKGAQQAGVREAPDEDGRALLRVARNAFAVPLPQEHKAERSLEGHPDAVTAVNEAFNFENEDMVAGCTQLDVYLPLRRHPCAERS